MLPLARPSLVAAALAATFMSTQAWTAPVAHPFNAFVDHVSAETGRDADDIRRDAYEELRRDGRISRDALERIGRGEEPGDAPLELELVRKLSQSESFRTRTGLAAVKDESISAKAGAAFDALQEKFVAKPAMGPAPKPKSDKLISPIESASDSALEAFRKLAETVVSADNTGIVTTAYKIKGDGNKRSGETKLDMIERLVKYSLHRDFPITGDDGGYSFDRLPKNMTAKDLETKAKDMTYLLTDEASPDAPQLKALLLKASKNGLVVLAGSGSGNNTFADIIVAADPNRLEFVVLMTSNFGSDS